MAYEYSTISVRDPNKFDMIEFIKVGSMTIMRREQGEPDYKLYEPETVTPGEFEGMLWNLGDVDLVEQYICPNSTLVIMRGRVKMPNGVPYYFFVPLDYNGKLPKEVANGIARCAELSGQPVT